MSWSQLANWLTRRRESAKERRLASRGDLVFRQAKDEGNEWLRDLGLVTTFVFDYCGMREARWLVVRAAHVDVRPPHFSFVTFEGPKGD
jgi:hypothetical protein